MSDKLLEQLKTNILDLDMKGTLGTVGTIVDGGGTTAAQGAVGAMSEALLVVGKRFQEGEWFLAELVYAGEIAREIMDRLSPLMETEAAESQGTIVIGTVAGDLHDLGKNIFINYAKSAGFKVVDLGVDVAVDRFIAARREHSPLALGMSCLLTSTDRKIGKVIDELTKQDLRDSVKVIIGGAALTEQFARAVGADAFAPDAITGIDIIKQWSAE